MTSKIVDHEKSFVHKNERPKTEKPVISNCRCGEIIKFLSADPLEDPLRSVKDTVNFFKTKAEQYREYWIEINKKLDRSEIKRHELESKIEDQLDAVYRKGFNDGKQLPSNCVCEFKIGENGPDGFVCNYCKKPINEK